MKTPHKHAELIKAWADGAEIEFRTKNAQELWALMDEPCWHLAWLEFRIKPEPKPDVRFQLRADVDGLKTYVRTAEHWERENLQLTFDGETGKLKSAEVL